MLAAYNLDVVLMECLLSFRKVILSWKQPKLFRKIPKSIQSVWYHSPVHALHFLSSSKVLAGVGNVLRLYDVMQEKILCTLTLKKFATIHNIVAQKISSNDEFLVGVGGNRFRAGFRLSSEYQLFTLFEDYDCDSIVCSSLEWNGGNSAWFGFLTAHSVLSLQEITCPEGTRKETVVTGLSPITCHSGVIITELSVKSPGWVVLAGSTFGKIDIYSSIQTVGDPGNGVMFHVETHSGLSSQKGTIYSLSSCYLPSSHCLRLASAAEDRSVNVWTHEMKTSKPSRTDYVGPWELLFVLNDGGLNSSIIFEARVWKVCVSTCGLLTTGEDCRVVWYPWDSSEGIQIITGAHRGRNIWSCDMLVSDNADYSPLLATGGNDGAICVHLLRPSQTRGVHKFSRIFSPEQLTMQEMTDVQLSTTQENLRTSNLADFPRCMFFGPTGRLFYLTDLGYIYTCEFDPVTNAVGNQTSVEILFWPRSFSGGIHSNQCEVKSHANEVILADQLLSADSPFWCLKVFHGYITCSTSSCHHLVAIGDRQGRMGLFELFDEKPFMVCTCMFDLGQKVMKLIWVSATQLLVGLQSKPAVVFTLQNAGSLKAFHDSTVYLQLPPGPEMRWVNAGICVPAQQTSACFDPQVDTKKAVSNLLVLGTRDGGLYTFCLSAAVKDAFIRTPAWSLENCHGHGGCTAVTLVPRTAHPPIILSAGRTHGEIRRWALCVNGSLVLLGVTPSSENLTWVDRFYAASDGRLFALGFQSVNFKVCELTHGSDLHFTTEYLTNDSSSFTVNCAGGNRCWDLWISSPRVMERRKLIVTNEESTDAQAYVGEICVQPCYGETALLAVINRRGVTIHGDRLRQHKLVGRSDGVVRLEPSLHGRDVNCCLLFTVPRCLGGVRRERTLFCLAGGEDTLLSSWSLQLDEKDVVSSSIPEHHRGQISNIRCMTTPLQAGSKWGTNNHSFTGGYLLTGGGRGQIGLWHLGFGLSDFWKDATVDLWHPGWLGSIRLRHIEAAHLSGAGGCESADLRVMSMVCVQPKFNTHSQVWLFTLVGCSDGSVRLITILPPCSSFPKSPKFSELGAIDEFLSETPSGYTPSCCLDLQPVDIGENELVVASTNSRSEVICWSVHWSSASTSDPDGVHWSVEQLWTLISEPIPPYYIQTSPAMCCLAVSTKPVSNIKMHYFAVGGDDGSLRLASARSNNCGPARPQWLASGVHHYATTLRVCFMTSESCQDTSVLTLLTLGADQRVVQWVFDTSSLILSAVQRSMIPGLGDPHDLTCVKSILPIVHELEDTCGEPVENDSTFVLVTGMGICLLRIS